MAGPFTVVTVLLAVAGTLKLGDPQPTAAALRSARLPAWPLAVRALGAAEIALAVVALAVGGPLPAALVGGLYAGFAVFVEVARRGGSVASCGCFGRSDTPPTGHHTLFNVGAAGVGLAAAITSVDPLATTLGDQPGAGIPFLFVAAITTYLAVVALTVLPATRRVALDPTPTAAPFRLHRARG